MPDETVNPGSPRFEAREYPGNQGSYSLQACDHLHTGWLHRTSQPNREFGFTKSEADELVAALNNAPGLVARVAALEAELAQEKQDHADDLDALASVRAERDRLRKALGLLTTDDVAEWLEANKHARATLAPKEPS